MAEETIPLAVPADVATALGRALTTSELASAYDRLLQASALFSHAAGRRFAGGRATVRLKVNGGEVRLPGADVEVHSVTHHGTPISYTRSTNIILVPLASHQFVDVDYTQGSDIPDLARTTVAEMVARTYRIDERARAGMSQFQETTGPFSEGGTFATWAIGGQLMLSPADQAAAHTFRGPRLPGTVVQRP